MQASFVTLMLTGGYAPCLPCWPITEIKLQGKIDGFETDDLVVFAENPSNKEQWKLLGQVKRSIAITKGSALFREVIQAAWNDFNNPKIFTRGKDVIALISGPLSATDARNVQWLLDQAKHTKDVHEFFRNVQQKKFSPPKSNEKLAAFHHHLEAANGGNEVTREQLYDFLNHFHLLSYDLGNESGIALSLLHSHVSQFQPQYPQRLWSQIVDIVQAWNQDAGTITPSNLPEDLLKAFERKAVVEMPKELEASQEKPVTDWSQHPDAAYLTLAVLIGAWNEQNQSDLHALAQVLGISYDEWLGKARELLHRPGSPLTLKNGVWSVVNRTELLHSLGSRILDQDLDAYKALAISILKEPDPAFDLPAEERYAASVYGKVPKYSRTLRKGIAEGLAILGTIPEACSNCSQGKAKTTCLSAVDEILTNADWILWGSLDGLLPALAEAAPRSFLDSVESALRSTPCPFDELFAQEGDGITGGNYLTGLLWALEALAWDDQYLVRICVVLGELASHDPGGRWANRPFNSLVTILLPWLPQTLASVDKRHVAVRTLLREWSEIGWDLIIRLLPNQHQTSFGSHKPSWRKTIPNDWEKGVTQQDYWQQISIYAELTVNSAGYDVARLAALIDRCNSLPQPEFDRLIDVLASQTVSELPEERRLLLWNRLTKFARNHRQYPDAKWALEEDLIVKLEKVADKLTPTDPFAVNQHLFSGNDSDLYDKNGDWEKQRRTLDIRREKAVAEIYRQSSIEGIIRFAESVNSPNQVGLALGVVNDDAIEQTLLPKFLDISDNKHKELVSGFVWQRHREFGWAWCDNIDRSNWTPAQIGQFLANLPSKKK
ncbi:MAG: hypothetical protein F4234_02580, partial [Gammaproteobacteria bacterium]|nr:hypothetical protein [Gammaproteobacteria bacterium]